MKVTEGLIKTLKITNKKIGVNKIGNKNNTNNVISVHSHSIGPTIILCFKYCNPKQISL